MVIRHAELETVCGITSRLPEHTMPEVAFSGRSNVGKSSLINGLLNRKSLARTSSQPGKTQTINFYNVNHEVYLVDLPGYGYAARGKDQRAALKRLIDGYILHREELTSLFVLIDIRHEPQKIDLEFLDWLGENGVPFAIVFTKADKLGVNAAQRNVEEYCRKLLKTWEELPPVFVTSSEKGTGREEILGYIYNINKEMENRCQIGDETSGTE